MTYGIIGTPTLKELVDEVNKAIAEGWQCLGGIAIDRNINIEAYGTDEYGTMYVQAMQKQEAVSNG